MDMKSLRYMDSKSDKFWTIQLSGCGHMVQYGRTGTAGQTQTKEFPTEAAARKSYEKLVAEKLKKGYVEGESIAQSEPLEIAPIPTPTPKSTETGPVEIPENWRSLAWMEIQGQLVQDEKPLCELAAIDAIPDDCWGLLSVEVKTAIAKKLFNPPQVYQKLAKDSHEAVRKAVAGNLYTPPELLSTLSRDSVEDVRLAVAKNSSAPRVVVEHLVQDAYQRVRKAALDNQAEYDVTLKLIPSHQTRQNDGIIEVEPLESLDQLEADQLLIWYEIIGVESLDYIVRVQNLMDPKSIPFQTTISQYLISRSVFYLGLINLSLTSHQSPEQLEQLFRDLTNCQPLECDEYQLLVSIAYNPNTPISALSELIEFQQTQNSLDPYKYESISRNIVLEVMAISRNIVLEAMALNPSIPHELMVKLVEKNDLRVAIALASNKKTPGHVLAMIDNRNNQAILKKGTDLELFYLALAHHPNTPPEILDRIIHKKFKASFSRNPPISILKHEDRWISGRLTPAQVALHNYYKRHAPTPQVSMRKIDKKPPTLSRYIQHLITHQPMLANSMHWCDRYAIAQNSHTSNDLLETLVQDEHPFVQAAARSVLGMEIITSPAIAVIPEPSVEKPKTVEVVPVELKIERSLNLNPEDYFWVNAQKLNFQPKTVIKIDSNIPPLDWPELVNSQSLQDIVITLLRVREHGNDLNFSVSKAVLQMYDRFSVLDVILQLFQFYLSDNQDIIALIPEILSPEYIDYRMKFPSWTKDEVIDALAKEIRYKADNLANQLVKDFKEYICFNLGSEERQAMRQQLQPILQSSSALTPHYKLAAYLGMAEEVQSIVNTWHSDGRNVKTPTESLDRDDVLEIVLGSGNAEQIIQNISRLNIRIEFTYMRAWLAATEYQGLDILYQNIQYEKEAAILGLAKTPEVAPYMMELWLSLRKPTVARQWLEENLDHAIVGLIPVIADTWTTPVRVKLGALKKAAIDFFLSLQRKGYTPLINAALEQESPEIAEKVRSHLVPIVDLDCPTFDRTTTPEWLSSGIRNLSSSKRSKSPTWVSFADLPLLMVGDRALTDEQVTAIITALSLSTLDSPLPLILDLKTHANSASLDTFVWSLFERWLMEGGPSKENWAMGALGLLGSDAIALKLTPLIRNWPLESQHPRAVFGLECLRKIGTDTALMQIHSIAQKIKFSGLKTRAQDCLEAIARDLALTSDQLADRIIPDCGLSETGQRSFDFGSRQFQFFLSADLKPMLRDPQGKSITTLPKPNSKDDADKAAEAIADWKLIKKQVSDVVKLHCARLESAMIEHRTWKYQEFHNFLVHHPLMTHLIQRLVWATYDAQGNITTTFRVAEDRTYTDAQDQPCGVDPDAIVGIPHPLTLDAALRTQWSETFSDYEIFQPFPQLQREVYGLTDEERSVFEITRFQEIGIPVVMLVRSLEAMGWQKGELHDFYDYTCHWKYFPFVNVTAIIGEYEHVFVDPSVSPDDSEKIDGCCFLPGVVDVYEYPYFHQTGKGPLNSALPLEQVDPVVISEVLRDLMEVISKVES